MGESLKRMGNSLKRMGGSLKGGVVGRVVTPSHSATDDNNENNYEVMTSPVASPTPEDEIYEPVEPIPQQQPSEDPQGYLIPEYPPRRQKNRQQPSNGSQHYRVPVYPPRSLESAQSSSKKNKDGLQTEAADTVSSRDGVISIYEDLWEYKKQNNASAGYDPASYTDQIYDEVESQIPAGTKIIPVEEPASAYDEVIVNDGRYMIPSRQWDSDSDAMESDFDEDTDAPNYFGDNLEQIYENLENRKLASPIPKTIVFNAAHDEEQQTVKKPARLGVVGNCFTGSLAKSTKTLERSSGHDDEESSLYVDPNNFGEKEPVMPPLSLDLLTEEAARYEIVKKILETEATYKENLSKLVQIEQDSRDRQLLEVENLDLIFCSLQSILQSHEMFSMVLAARMNEWTVEGKLGDVICASFTKSTTTMAYIDFVNNFLAAIDAFRAACKTNSSFGQYVQAKVNGLKPKTSFHDLMLTPFKRFPEFIRLIQDLLEITAVSHVDRVPLQLALTQLEYLAELINSRRKESEMKSQLKYLDTQISQLSKPLSSSGRVFIRQDDMIHCLIDGVSVVETKKLRLVLLSDMLLCLSPVGKKKRIVSGLLNPPKYKFKLKWNVPLSDVEFVEYGTGVSVAAGKYGTITTYTDQGKYRQATLEVQKHIENLHHDLAVIGQIAGLASSLRGKHQLLDQHKVQQWHKSVENTITEEMKTVNMFWLELSLPTKSGQHNYVFNLSSPTVKEEWQADATNAKLALESRNNPGWYLPEDDIIGGLSILRRNMPLLAEFFDLFVFNARSTIEHTITYPVENSNIPSSMAARGLGYYVWISARGEMQGRVSVLRFERNACAPRFMESFHVCPGTVYSMAHIPAMNSRSDQTADKYHTKYGFPFPTIWLGSHSSKIYIYDAKPDDRSRPLMELKLRDAPLAMKFASRKVYVGLANGTLAIFRSNTSGHWNLVQPSILPLGRLPVAMIADVKDNLWCSSGSQIYVVSKKGDRIQRIIAVDSNMKNLVKHVVSCGVGVWVSVWKKATIKLYHAETCEMMQELNVVSRVVKMRNDVDSQVQYLSVDKISVTALLFIPGFLWVGTSVGLILLYPLPKMQGVPRVVGRACVAFHAHCGPVRSLLAIPQGVVAEETKSDDVSAEDEDPNEINRKFSMLADSEESVGSDEDFYFVDDNKPSPKKGKLSSSDPLRLKVSVKSAQQASVRSADTELPSNGNSGGFDISKPDDFARMMETFDGFNQDSLSKNEATGEKNVRSFRNRLFAATQAKGSQENRNPPNLEEFPMLDANKIRGTNAPSGFQKGETKPGENCSRKGGGKEASVASASTDLSASDINSGKILDFDGEKSLASGKSPDDTGNTVNSAALTSVDGNIDVLEKHPSCTDEQNIEYGNIPVDGTNQVATASNPLEDTRRGNSSSVGSGDNAIKEHHKDAAEQSIFVNIPEEKSNDLAKTSLPSKDSSTEDLITSKQKRSSHELDENATSSTNSVPASTCSEADQQQKRDNDQTSSEGSRIDSSTPSPGEKSPATNSSTPGGKEPATSSSSSNPLETSSETYVTVLPTTLEKRVDGNNTDASNGVVAAEGDLETEPDSWLNKTGKSRGKCLSYVVVSGGEGHVDLRLKVKSRHDLKKDGQSMLLIWRVNSKV